MTAWFKRLLGIAETDLSKILSSFHRTLADLRAHVQHHQDAADTHLQAALDHKEAADSHVAQAAEASVIAKNIGQLIGRPESENSTPL